jgi:hypothetical protein
MSTRSIAEYRVVEMVEAAIARAGSVRALARRWKVSAAYLSDIRHGRRAPGVKVLRRIGITAHVQREVTYTLDCVR